MLNSINEMTVEQYLGFKEQGLLDGEVLEAIGYSSNSQPLLTKWKKERKFEAHLKNRKSLAKKKLNDFTIDQYNTMKLNGLKDTEIADVLKVHWRTLNNWKKKQREEGNLPAYKTIH